jgi:hypothetical protein
MGGSGVLCRLSAFGSLLSFRQQSVRFSRGLTFNACPLVWTHGAAA